MKQVLKIAAGGFFLPVKFQVLLKPETVLQNTWYACTVGHFDINQILMFQAVLIYYHVNS